MGELPLKPSGLAHASDCKLAGLVVSSAADFVWLTAAVTAAVGWLGLAGSC